MASSSGLLFTNGLCRPLERASFRIAVVSFGLLGTIAGRGQGVEVTAGFVHGWGADLVSEDLIKPSAVGNGWRLTAAYHFGADAVTHMSLGVGWTTVYWSQKFRVVGPYDVRADTYDRSGTMETRTGLAFLSPMLCVHLSKRIRLLVGADLGLNVQAHRHEKSSATILGDNGYHGHTGGGVGHISVDTIFNDMEQMNPFFLAAFVGLEYSVAKHWGGRAEGVPYSGRFTSTYGPSSRPFYFRFIVSYHLFKASV